MNHRQRKIVRGTLEVIGGLLLGCWVAGALVAVFSGVWNPLMALYASLLWGFVGVAAIYVFAGEWPTFAVVAMILVAFFVRAGRTADAN